MPTDTLSKTYKALKKSLQDFDHVDGNLIELEGEVKLGQDMKRLLADFHQSQIRLWFEDKLLKGRAAKDDQLELELNYEHFSALYADGTHKEIIGEPTIKTKTTSQDGYIINGKIEELRKVFSGCQGSEDYLVKEGSGNNTKITGINLSKLPDAGITIKNFELFVKMEKENKGMLDKVNLEATVSVSKDKIGECVDNEKYNKGVVAQWNKNKNAVVKHLEDNMRRVIGVDLVYQLKDITLRDSLAQEDESTPQARQALEGELNEFISKATIALDEHKRKLLDKYNKAEIFKEPEEKLQKAVAEHKTKLEKAAKSLSGNEETTVSNKPKALNETLGNASTLFNHLIKNEIIKLATVKGKSDVKYKDKNDNDATLTITKEDASDFGVTGENEEPSKSLWQALVIKKLGEKDFFAYADAQVQRRTPDAGSAAASSSKCNLADIYKDFLEKDLESIQDNQPIYNGQRRLDESLKQLQEIQGSVEFDEFIKKLEQNARQAATKELASFYYSLLEEIKSPIKSELKRTGEVVNLLGVKAFDFHFMRVMKPTNKRIEQVMVENNIPLGLDTNASTVDQGEDTPIVKENIKGNEGLLAFKKFNVETKTQNGVSITQKKAGMVLTTGAKKNVVTIYNPVLKENETIKDIDKMAIAAVLNLVTNYDKTKGNDISIKSKDKHQAEVMHAALLYLKYNDTSGMLKDMKIRNFNGDAEGPGNEWHSFQKTLDLNFVKDKITGENYKHLEGMSKHVSEALSEKKSQEGYKNLFKNLREKEELKEEVKDSDSPEMGLDASSPTQGG